SLFGSWLALQLMLDPPADPAHHRHRLAVADGLVARSVRAFLCRLAAPWDERVVVGHALKAFALARGKSADPCRSGRDRLATPGTVLARIESIRLERVGYLTGDADRIFLPGVSAQGVCLVHLYTWVLRAMN